MSFESKAPKKKTTNKVVIVTFKDNSSALADYTANVRWHQTKVILLFFICVNKKICNNNSSDNVF